MGDVPIHSLHAFPYEPDLYESSLAVFLLLLLGGLEFVISTGAFHILIPFKDFSPSMQLIVVHVGDGSATAVTGNMYLQLLCNSSIFL